MLVDGGIRDRADTTPGHPPHLAASTMHDSPAPESRNVQVAECRASASSETSTVFSRGCTESSSDNDPDADHVPKAGLDQNGLGHEPSMMRRSTPLNTKPRYVHDFRWSSLDWDDLASDREQRSSLHLRGLPLRLCQLGPFMSLMKAHGLSDAIESVEAPVRVAGKSKTALNPKDARRSKLGCLIVRLRSPSEVRPIAKFFHGRLFGGRMPVAVSFAPLYAPNYATLDEKVLDTSKELHKMAASTASPE